LDDHQRQEGQSPTSGQDQSFTHGNSSGYQAEQGFNNCPKLELTGQVLVDSYLTRVPAEQGFNNCPKLELTGQVLADTYLTRVPANELDIIGNKELDTDEH
jgi:hypothetical protein